jgi:hypothetical protein
MRQVARVLSYGFAQAGTIAGSVDYIEFSRWLLSRFFLLLGGVLVLLGLLDLLTPLPFGIPLILLGMTIILNTSQSAKKAFVRAGRRYPRTVGRVRGMMRAHTRASFRRRRDASAAAT